MYLTRTAHYAVKPLAIGGAKAAAAAPAAPAVPPPPPPPVAVRSDAELDALKEGRTYAGPAAAVEEAQPQKKASESMSSKWKDVLFKEGSLFDMDDPWSQVR